MQGSGHSSGPEGAPAEPRVAIVVLSWNGREHVLDCLSSLRRLEWDRLFTIVVDNGSTDGTGDAVRAAFPEIDVVSTGRNLGFAEGNNVGMRRALERGADWILLLNDDTVADPLLVSALMQHGAGLPEVGALCPKIYYSNPPDMIWYAGGSFDPRRGYNGAHVGFRERDRGQFDEVREVTRPTGAAMCISRAVVESVGMLDGQLFCTVEEVEWSIRMRHSGYRVYYVPQGKVWHKVSSAMGGENSPTIAYYAMRNTLEVCNRHAPLKGLAAVRRHAAAVIANVLYALRSPNRWMNLRMIMEGRRDYRRGMLGPRGRLAARSPLAS